MNLCDHLRVSNSDKHSTHHYCEYYERHLPNRNAHFRLLELGVEEGKSLRAWEKYFLNAEIVGVDHNIECLVGKLNERFAESMGVIQKAHVIISEQDDQKLAHYAPFDVIIDDASHVAIKTRNSFRLLFPLLSIGGLYVIEDLETSYYPSGTHGRPYEGGRPGHQGTAVEMVKGLIDDLNMKYHGRPPIWTRMISEIHLYENIVFIRKG